MKRRLTVKARKRSIDIIDVSPSKRLRRRSLATSLPSSLKAPASQTIREDDSSSCLNPTADILEGSLPTLDYTHEEGNDYNAKKQKEADAWEAIRDQLLKVSVEASCLPSAAKCCECEEPASIRCKECGPLVFYCSACIEHKHSLKHTLHTPEIWKVL